MSSTPNEKSITNDRFLVFLSSVDQPEVRKYRQAAIEVLESDAFKYDFVAVEMTGRGFEPSNQPSIEVVEREVKKCSVFVSLVGPFLGSLVPEGSISFCQFEYEVAYARWKFDKANLKIGIFLLPENDIIRASIDPSNTQTSLIDFMRTYGPSIEKQADFRSLVSKHHFKEVGGLENFKREFSNYLRSLNMSEFTNTSSSSLEAIDSPLQFGAIPQGHSFKNYSKAFQIMDDVVVRTLIDQQKKEGKLPAINMKLISVAMTFSWRDVIETIIPRLLEDEPTLRLQMSLLFVDASHLETAELAIDPVNYPTNWVAESKNTQQKAITYAETLTKSGETRLGISIKSYKNLPHWHGWLVNDTYLFLGRTNWKFVGSNAYLQVGQSKYRYFDNTNGAEGKERVDIFLEWHKYYWNFASKTICSYPVNTD